MRIRIMIQNSSTTFTPMSRIEDLEKMLDESPDDPFLIFALAKEYEKQEGTLQALLMYEHLVTNFPSYIPTYYHYAKVLQKAGNKSEALLLLQKGIEEGTKAKEMHAVSEMSGLLNLWSGVEEDE